MFMAEREGFEPPIALRLCLISSQVHSTGLCHLSVDVILHEVGSVFRVLLVQVRRCFVEVKGDLGRVLRRSLAIGWSQSDRAMTGWTEERVRWLRERAGEAGFTLAGVAAADGTSAAEQMDGERFEAWIAAGFAGEMEYLKRRDESGQLLRSAVTVATPWARSVVLCAMQYRGEGPLSMEEAAAGAGWIGRYAWSGAQAEDQPKALESAVAMRATDYHEVLLQRLRELEQVIRAKMPCESRCYVDTGPMVERAIAARAGVGWIGKNTTVINEGVGSWTLLASIITSIPMEASGFVMEAADRCGSCTRCLDACPTEALVAPRQMDARRCIAYLTIEKKGAIDEELRAGMGRQVFGCDICQDVCPWNRRAPVVPDSAMLPRKELINPDLEWLAGMSSAEFRRWFKGSPLERTGKKRLQRNVAIAMGNSGEERFRERLEAWATSDDAVLAEAARWALARLGANGGERVTALRR